MTRIYATYRAHSYLKKFLNYDVAITWGYVALCTEIWSKLENAARARSKKPGTTYSTTRVQIAISFSLQLYFSFVKICFNK